MALTLPNMKREERCSRASAREGGMGDLRTAEAVGRKQHLRHVQGRAGPSPLSQKQEAGIEVKVMGTEGARNIRSEAGPDCPHGC